MWEVRGGTTTACAYGLALLHSCQRPLTLERFYWLPVSHIRTIQSKVGSVRRMRLDDSSMNDQHDWKLCNKTVKLPHTKHERDLKWYSGQKKNAQSDKRTNTKNWFTWHRPIFERKTCLKRYFDFMDQVSSKVIHDVSGQKKLISFNPIQGRITTQTVRDEEEYMEVSLDLWVYSFCWFDEIIFLTQFDTIMKIICNYPLRVLRLFFVPCMFGVSVRNVKVNWSFRILAICCSYVVFKVIFLVLDLEYYNC